MISSGGALKLSVIVPVHNEGRNIVPFYERTRTVLEKLEGITEWNIVYVNDASEDDSLNEILKLRLTDSRVGVVTLSRRFGYHGVLMAGLCTVASDLYAMIDVDCEDPPELLADFLSAIHEGAQVAYGIRSNREEPYVITLCRKLFYHATKRIADSEIVVWMAEFAMITKQVRDAIVLPRTTYPFLRAELGYVGFKRVGVEYFRAKRQHGRSHYNLWKMTRFAVAGMLSSSTFLLRLVLYIAVVLGVGYPVAVLALSLSRQAAVGTAIILSFYFLLVSIPTLALYIARTYKNGVFRPVFIIDHSQTHL